MTKKKLSYAKGGATDDVIMIEIGGDKKYPYYIKKIDTTHIAMANNKDGVDLVVPSHILQHKGESYYDDVRSWLKGGQSPDGKSYDSDYYAKGGIVSIDEKRERVIDYFINNEDDEELISRMGNNIKNNYRDWAKEILEDRDGNYDEIYQRISDNYDDEDVNYFYYQYSLSPIYEDGYWEDYAKGGVLDSDEKQEIDDLIDIDIHKYNEYDDLGVKPPTYDEYADSVIEYEITDKSKRDAVLEYIKSTLGKRDEYIKYWKEEDYAKGGVITIGNSSHSSQEAENKKAFDLLNEKLISDKNNPLYNEFQEEKLYLDDTNGFVSIVGGVYDEYSPSDKKIKDFKEYLKGFLSMDSNIYIKDKIIAYNNYLKYESMDSDEEYDEDDYFDLYNPHLAKGGWIDFKSKREINKIIKELEDKNLAFQIRYDNDGKRFGLKGGGRYRIKAEDEFSKGGDLDKEFKFDSNFIIYVPSTSDVSSQISKDELNSRVEEVKEFVSNHFGGYTETQADGGYKSDSGDVVEEDVVKVSVFAKEKDWENRENLIVSQVKEWANKWGQEAIGFEYEDANGKRKLYYIDRDGKKGFGGFLFGTAVGGYAGYKYGLTKDKRDRADLFRTEQKYYGRAKSKYQDYKDRKRKGGPDIVDVDYEEFAKGGKLSEDEFRDGIGNTAFQLVEEGGGSAKLGEYVEEGIQNYVDKFYAKGGEIDEYYSKMIEKLGKKGTFERVLKDSQFGNYKGTPSNEFKHNRLPKTAIIGKNSVSITSYTPNTKRYLDSQTFTSPKELAEYLDKNQIYAKGGNLPVDAKVYSNDKGIYTIVDADSVFEMTDDFKGKYIGELTDFPSDITHWGKVIDIKEMSKPMQMGISQLKKI